MKKYCYFNLRFSVIFVVAAAILFFVLLFNYKNVQHQEKLKKTKQDLIDIENAKEEHEKALEDINKGLNESSVEVVDLAITEIPEPPETSETSRQNMLVEDVSVKLEIPDVIKLDESHSALKLPRSYGAAQFRSRQPQVAVWNCSGGSSRRAMSKYYPTERYKTYPENNWKDPRSNPLTTVSAAVDTASYSNCRRYMTKGITPPSEAVRIEDFINYLDYDYEKPEKGNAFSINIELNECPWNKDHELLLLGLKGKTDDTNIEKRSSNYVFLIDVSGSMANEDKLPLLKSSMTALTNALKPEDRISVVTYASNTHAILNGTQGNDKETITDCIDSLSARGCTYGESGIKLAYKIAEKNFIKGGNNRIILATDGDFNVGVTSDEELKKLIEEKRKSEIFLTILGFGQGNLNDSMMMQLAKHGNGNYFYIDTFNEARKVLLTDMAKNLFTIAKDVKIQLEFNPKYVSEYKLIGYESRKLKSEDFDDDTKDAGDIGSGHTITYLYEIKRNLNDQNSSSSKLRYQKQVLTESSDSKELMSVKIRYKEPNAKNSKLIEKLAILENLQKKSCSDNFIKASTAAGFAMKLKGSPEVKDLSYSDLIQKLKACKSKDDYGYRMDLNNLLLNMQAISGNQKRVGMSSDYWD